MQRHLKKKRAIKTNLKIVNLISTGAVAVQNFLSVCHCLCSRRSDRHFLPLCHDIVQIFVRRPPHLSVISQKEYLSALFFTFCSSMLLCTKLFETETLNSVFKQASLHIHLKDRRMYFKHRRLVNLSVECF